jgi:hypothetical protein
MICRRKTNQMAFEAKLHGFDLPTAKQMGDERTVATPEEQAILDAELTRAIERKKAAAGR